MDFSTHRFSPNRVPIANRVKEGTKRPNRQLDSNRVDVLLETYAELIDPRYTHWFAKHFYYMNEDVVTQCASEARADGKDSRRLFSFLIRKRSNANA